ncbi:uncharacterized protein LOC126842074 isoform X2 [Adelges cooleyi]|uniref:uncharacterized protein LOC126842074 isoform X2 n=1 Tax=Adelges cooleyi TaxID=133065 RepID=UPI0021807C56|nr:uncharacterized protein LOC126842074 isoform X2 [Adelges cooleyi]
MNDECSIATDVENKFKFNETEDKPRIKIEVGETDNYNYKSIFETGENNEQLNEQQQTIDGNAYSVRETCVDTEVKVEIKNSGLSDSQTINYKNSFSDNGTRNKVDKKLTVVISNRRLKQITINRQKPRIIVNI